MIFIPKGKASPHNVTVQTDLCPHNMSNTTHTYTHKHTPRQTKPDTVGEYVN